jgi:TetR/AcrR family transcriptional regulator, transcriptional repressor for nem operon
MDFSMDAQGKESSRKCDQLLAAAERLMLQRGFWGTSVDDVCRAAGVSKGAFFHYFDDKEELALAALDQFVMKMALRVREAVGSIDPTDAYGRICAYCDLVADSAQVRRSQQGCLIAAFVMDSRSDDRKFAERCAAHFGAWIELLRHEFLSALAPVRWPNPGTPTELAQLCVCVIEGALILARGRGDPSIVVSALEHFKRYIAMTLEQAGCLPCGATTPVPAPTIDVTLSIRRKQLSAARRARGAPRLARKITASECDGGGAPARARKAMATSRR